MQTKLTENNEVADKKKIDDVPAVPAQRNSRRKRNGNNETFI
jgi:hypothetical protein